MDDPEKDLKVRDLRERNKIEGRKKRVAVSIVISLLVLVAFVGLMAGLLPQKADPEEAAATPTPSAQPADSPCTEGPWCELRLTKSIYPEHYNLLLYPDLENDNFTGTVHIDIVVTEPVKFPRIHVKKMTVTLSEIRPAGVPSSKPALPVVRAFDFVPNQFYVMEMEADLEPGKYVWSLEFQGGLKSSGVGLYSTIYINEDDEARVLAVSKFEPTDARRAFPCFDEPNLKANFTITLVHPGPPYYALSNMNNVSTTAYGSDGMLQTNFATSVKMSTYLAAFVVCDFDYKEKILESGIPLRMYASPHEIDKGDYSLEVAVKMTDFFEEYFDLAYPLPKLDMIAVPNYRPAGMEHWGLIMYRDSSVLYSEQDCTVADKQSTAHLVAHELAHQWFGNIVTMDWWDDLWLNEGFASYMEYIGVDICHPDWQTMTLFRNEDFTYAMTKDQTLSSDPIIPIVEEADQAYKVFSTITYKKGASVLRMLENVVGEDVFKAGVLAYLKKYQFKNTVTDDLWRELTQASKDNGDNINVKQIMDSWTLQMGFPVVSLTKTVSGSDLKFDAVQDWFLLDPDANKTDEYSDPSVFNYTWNIPFNYYVESDVSRVVKEYMNFTGVSFDKPGSDGEWYVANYGQYGFFRVNYDQDNWGLLRDQLINNHTVIDVVDRTGLLDDAFNLARAGIIDYTIPLDLTIYLIDETEYTPWDAAYHGISWLREMLRYQPAFAKFRMNRYFAEMGMGRVATWGMAIIRRPKEYHWKKYFARLSAPLMARLTWNDEGKHLDRFLRSDIIYMACGFGEPGCLSGAVVRFRQYLNGTSIPPNIRRHAYRFGMEEIGDQDSWDFMWEMYKLNTTESNVKSHLRYGMARTRHVWLLARYLEYCLDSKIPPYDFWSTFRSIAWNPVGRSLAWDWWQANHNYLLDKYRVPDSYFDRLIASITSAWNTEQKLTELENFWAKYPDEDTAKTRYYALERIKTNIKWLAKNEQTISDWLDRNV